MRKIIVLSFITLDGVMQAPGGPDEDKSSGFKYGGWQAPYFDDASGKIMEKLMKPTDVLLGRKTYDIFASYWPDHADMWPGINDVTKFVVSHKNMKPSWQNTEVITGEVVDKLKRLKNGRGSSIQVWGSGNLIQTLLKHDLVDEFWLITHPLTLGQGKKLFEDGAMPAAFKLLESSVTPKGVIFAHYKRAGKVKTGTVGA